MKFEVKFLTPKEWLQISSEAHYTVFNEYREVGKDRIDFALLLLDKKEDCPCGYITCRELDSETAYWQYGGSFPKYQKTINVLDGFMEFVDWSRDAEYKRILTYVKNDNFPMLKFYMKLGAKIIGVKNINNEIFLEHLIEL